MRHYNDKRGERIVRKYLKIDCGLRKEDVDEIAKCWEIKAIVSIEELGGYEEIKFEPELNNQTLETSKFLDVDKPVDPASHYILPDTLKENFYHFIEGIANNNEFFDRLFVLRTLENFKEF